MFPLSRAVNFVLKLNGRPEAANVPMEHSMMVRRSIWSCSHVSLSNLESINTADVRRRAARRDRAGAGGGDAHGALRGAAAPAAVLHLGPI